MKQHNKLSPQLWAEAEDFFDFQQFKTLTSSVRDADDTSAAAEDGNGEKKATDCNCATNEGDCGSGSVCISWTQEVV